MLHELSNEEKISKELAQSIVEWFGSLVFTDYVGPDIQRECEIYRQVALDAAKSGDVVKAAVYAAWGDMYDRLMSILDRAKKSLDSE